MLVLGMRVLMYSVDVLNEYEIENHPEEGEPVEPGSLEKWLAGNFGEKGAWDFMLVTSVIVAVLISIFFFVMLPTWLVGFLKTWKISPIALNLIEGISRIVLFVAYVIMISKMEDINRTFQFHGAEHKYIHCFKNGLELTPENCQNFYTLHPR